MPNLTQSLRKLLLPSKNDPQMPKSAAEARLISQSWLQLGGRSYFIADVVLDRRILLKYVTFDADTGIAISMGDQWLGDLPEYFGRRITGLLRVRDPEGIHASYAEREAFARQHQRLELPRWLRHR
jgi:hypothetical protein